MKLEPKQILRQIILYESEQAEPDQKADLFQNAREGGEIY